MYIGRYLLAIFIPATLLLFLLFPTISTAQHIESGTDPSFSQRVLELVNIERWTHGRLPPLKGVSTLNDAAHTHSSNMALRNFFDHCDLDTRSLPWDRMEAAGYTNWNYAGENIAAGYTTPENAMTGWMNSSGHRANILSTEFREIGVGFVQQPDDQNNVRNDTNGDCQADTYNGGPYYTYWTQNFGRRNDVFPLIINREAFQTDNLTVELYSYGSGWAQSMRFRNEAGNWSSWQPFTAVNNWTLTCTNGLKTVHVEMSSGPNGAGIIRTAQDEILLQNNQSSLSYTPAAFTFVTYAPKAPPQISQILTLQNNGSTAVTWTIGEQPIADWLAVSPSQGQLEPCTQVQITVTALLTAVQPGTYHANLLISSSQNPKPWQLPVTLLHTNQPPIYLPIVIK